MRNPERIKRILELIQKIWRKYPDLRFMQLQNHLMQEYSARNDRVGEQYLYEKYGSNTGEHFKFVKVFAGVDLFYLEDDKFEEFLVEYLEEED